MSWLRPIDAWMLEQVLPYQSHYLRQARRWSRNDQEAADLVQEAYLKLLQIDNWAAIRDPRSYTTTTIRNLLLQRVRRDRIVAIADIPTPSLEEVRDEVPSSFEVAAAREALVGLLGEVDRLPPMCRRVIRMRKFEDRSTREIAVALGISLSTVETHLARGMQQLIAWRRRTVQLPLPPAGPALTTDEAEVPMASNQER